MQNFIDWITRGAIFVGALIPVVVCGYVLIAHGKMLFWPLGRIKRLTYWEGLATWLFLQIILFMYVLTAMMYMMYPLVKWLNDPSYGIYAGFFYLAYFLQFFCAIWSLAAICAKRWHDLNLTGWLAAINAAPLVVAAWIFMTFYDNVGRAMLFHLATDKDALGLSQNAFTYLEQGFTEYWNNTLVPNGFYYAFVAAVLLGSFIYLGASKGSNAGNAYGKTVA